MRSLDILYCNIHIITVQRKYVSNIFYSYKYWSRSVNCVLRFAEPFSDGDYYCCFLFFFTLIMMHNSNIRSNGKYIEHDHMQKMRRIFFLQTMHILNYICIFCKSIAREVTCDPSHTLGGTKNCQTIKMSVDYT